MIARHHTLFQVKFSDDLPLWGGPAVKKKLRFSKACVLITPEIMHSKDVQCNSGE